MRRGRTGSPGPETQDAYFAIEQFTVWINSADSKAGFLSAALAIIVNGLVLALDSRAGGFRHLGELGPVVATAFVTCALCALACTAALVLAIYPHVYRQPHSRYSWPSVAESDPLALAAAASVATRGEAWVTARSLALINRRKYRCLRFSFVFWIAALAALLLAVLAS